MHMKLYAAGKIAKNDWRGTRTAANALNWSDEPRDHLTDCEVEILPGVVYVGPWFISCDHGCYHGDNNHGVGASSEYQCCGEDVDLQQAKRDTLANSLHQIKKADLIYVRLDSREAFGTYAEVGYASALGKPIYIDVPEGSEELVRGLWFLLQMSLSSPLRQEDLSRIPFWTRPPLGLRSYKERLQSLIDQGDEALERFDL